ncbi:putative AAA+ ATPase domain, ATPase, AAA-type, core [Dioscorea sansibarensis]
MPAPMVERRKPLVLYSNRVILDSLLNVAKSKDGVLPEARVRASADHDLEPVRLTAGILRFADNGSRAAAEFNEDSFLVGVSISTLRKLAVTSGSLVIVKNCTFNVQRIVKIIVLDHPTYSKFKESSEQTSSSLFASPQSNVLPSFTYSSKNFGLLDEGVAYVTPLLAFNLGLHVSCLGGRESLKFLLDGEGHEEGMLTNSSFFHIELTPSLYLPRYASHLRVSFVKVPECRVLASLRGSSELEADDRQKMIDMALHEFFKVDRLLAKGDLFCIHINWRCGSGICVACNQNGTTNSSSNVIYFKVSAMEPTSEPILRVSNKQTALVLSGSVSSGIPPDSFVGMPKEIPLHRDTIELLASIIAPTLFPTALLPKLWVTVFLHGPSGCGKRTVVKYVARCFGLHVVEFSCYDFMSSTERKASVALANAFKAASRYSPSILLLRHLDGFGNLSSNEGSPMDQVSIASEFASTVREFTRPSSEAGFLSLEKESNSTPNISEVETLIQHRVLLIATASSPEGLQPPIMRCFTHEISMSPLNETQRATMLSQSIQGASNIHDRNANNEFIKDTIGQTSGFMPRDIRALVADASSSFIHKVLDSVQVEQVEGITKIEATEDNNSDGFACQKLGTEDFLKALERSKKRNASALGTPKVPNVKWEDVGGLEDVKKAIWDTVQLPLLYKDLFSSGLRKRSGVLLYGPPGTGKTLLAKAVATECSLNFLSVKGPELINMYIGESEKNVRDIFQKARSARPCVIFFDELDSLAPARGASGDSGGVMDRVVSQMLAEIDGLNDSTQDLFIIGASNRPDLIDPALLRPGRFDKLLYVGVNSDASYRERVLRALTRKFNLHENVSLLSVAEKCSPNMTGADMYALCADAWFHAAKRKATHQPSDSSSIAERHDAVIVETDDFMKVLVDLTPSLSMAELRKYELLRDQFEGVSSK